MTKVQFNDMEREKYGEIALQFSLISYGGLILAQATSEKGVSLMLAISGAIAVGLGVYVARRFLSKVKNRG